MLPALTPLAAIAPSAEPGCGATDNAWCELIFDASGQAWLARIAGTVIDGTLRTLLIVAIAIAVRMVCHRGINRIARGVGQGRAPGLLRPLRERVNSKAHQNGGMVLSERRRQRAATIGSLLRSASTFLIYGTAFVLILGEFGVNIAPIIASAGVIGVAVGFGAQNLIKDFLSGIFMMLEDQYGVGDVVNLGQASGTVESIGLRVCTVRDVEGTLWYVRNGEITRVGNLSQHFAVALVDIPLGYGTDIARASETAERAARDALAEPALAKLVTGEPTVLGVQTLTTEGLTLRVTVTTRPGKQAVVRRAMSEAVTVAYTDAGIPPPITTNTLRDSA